MTQSDRLIPEGARCSTCKGAGWTSWTGVAEEGEPTPEPKWIVCRECIGTGRSDHKGRKRLKPEGAPSA